jgi:thymidylate synthase
MIAGSNHNEISENIKSIGVDDDKNLHEHLDKLNVPRRTLSLMWQQRSVDLFLGLPFNIASYALLLEMLAQSCNMVADELIFNGGDCHIYTNHFNQVDEQLKREPMELCKLELTKPDSQYSSLHGNNGHIIEYKYENFKFVDYKSHPAIKAPIAI